MDLLVPESPPSLCWISAQKRFRQCQLGSLPVLDMFKWLLWNHWSRNLQNACIVTCAAKSQRNLWIPLWQPASSWYLIGTRQFLAANCKTSGSRSAMPITISTRCCCCSWSRPFRPPFHVECVWPRRSRVVITKVQTYGFWNKPTSTASAKECKPHNVDLYAWLC